MFNYLVCKTTQATSEIKNEYELYHIRCLICTIYLCTWFGSNCYMFLCPSFFNENAWKINQVRKRSHVLSSLVVNALVKEVKVV